MGKISRKQQRRSWLAERESIRALQRMPFEQVVREWQTNSPIFQPAWKLAQQNGWSKKEFQNEAAKRGW